MTRHIIPWTSASMLDRFFDDALVAMRHKLHAAYGALPLGQKSGHEIGKARPKIGNGNGCALKRRSASDDDAVGMGVIVEPTETPAKALAKG